MKFLSFKHFYTHAYSVHLDPKKLVVLVQSIHKTLRLFLEDLHQAGIKVNL